MSLKSDIYRNKFIKIYLFFVGCAVLATIASPIMLTDPKLYIGPPPSVESTINNMLEIDIESLIGILLIMTFIYVKEPDPTKIITKMRFEKIAFKHMFFIVFYPITFFATILFSQSFLHSNIPVIIVSLFGIMWIILYAKQLYQIFDVFVIYVKDELYPDSWPAIEKDIGRFEQWLQYKGSIEEQKFYNNLKKGSPDQAHEYAQEKAIERKKKDLKNKSPEKINYFTFSILIIILVLFTLLMVRNS